MSSSAWRLLRALAGIVMFGALAAAQAADYPSDKPIRMIVGFTAGGAADKLIRPVADHVSKAIGQVIVMDYRPGAGGAIALETLARSPADGYTLHIIAQGAMTFGPTLRRASFDPLRDFTPVAMLAGAGTVIVVRPDSPARDIDAFIALARANPDSWSYGTSGVGGSPHLAAEQFKLATGVKISHVPYKGGAPALTDLLGGHVPVLFSSFGAVASNLEAGQVRPLAVTSIKRNSMFPEVPTLAESGLAGFDSTAWFGIVGPAGLPPQVMAVLVPAFNAALDDPVVQRQIRQEGYDTMPMTPDAMREQIRAETDRWADLIRRTGMRPE